MKQNLPLFDDDNNFSKNKNENEYEECGYIHESPKKKDSLNKINFIGSRFDNSEAKIKKFPYSTNINIENTEKEIEYKRRKALNFRNIEQFNIDTNENNITLGSTKKDLKKMIIRKKTIEETQYQIEEIRKENEDKKKKQEIKKTEKSYIYFQKLQNLVDHNIFVIFFMVLTVFIMFINDIKIGYLPNSVDEFIDAVQSITFILFCLEIVLTSLAKKDYVNSFFFWLDVISTISILQDISFIFDPILQIGSE